MASFFSWEKRGSVFFERRFIFFLAPWSLGINGATRSCLPRGVDLARQSGCSVKKKLHSWTNENSWFGIFIALFTQPFFLSSNAHFSKVGTENRLTTSFSVNCSFPWLVVVVEKATSILFRFGYWCLKFHVISICNCNCVVCNQ